eukprot:jgi/Orpsp1_1/1186598/evm.model.d7180000051812.1
MHVIVLISILFKVSDISYISYNNTEAVSNKEIFQNFLSSSSYNDIYLGLIYPNNNNNNNNENELMTDLIIKNEIFSNLTINPIVFDTEKSLDEFNDDSNNKDRKLLAGIVFQDDFSSYTLRMDHSIIPNPKLEPISNLYNILTNKTDADNYLNFFVPIQSAVDQALIQHKTNLPIHISSNFGSLAIPKFMDNEVMKSLYTITFMIFFYIFFITLYLPNYLVDEKEFGIKKYLMINGVSSSVYYLSWFLLYGALVFIPLILSFIMDLLLKSFSIENIILKFYSLCFFSIGIIPMLMFCSLFFSSSKTLGQLTSMLAIAHMYIPFIYDYIKDDITIFDYIFICLPANRIITNAYESKITGYASFSDIIKNTNLISCTICMIVCTLLFTLLTLIFEPIFNEESEPVLSKIFKKKSNKNGNYAEHLSNNSEGYLEDIEDYHSNEKCLAEISNVIKKFKINKKNKQNANNEVIKNNEFYAVNNVSFKVYENEIFGILGHNGAGKSTLLSVMIGLINPNEGHIYYDGEDFISNKNKIRSLF